MSASHSFSPYSWISQRKTSQIYLKSKKTIFRIQYEHVDLEFYRPKMRIIHLNQFWTFPAACINCGNSINPSPNTIKSQGRFFRPKKSPATAKEPWATSHFKQASFRQSDLFGVVRIYILSSSGWLHSRQRLTLRMKQPINCQLVFRLKWLNKAKLKARKKVPNIELCFPFRRNKNGQRIGYSIWKA